MQDMQDMQQPCRCLCMWKFHPDRQPELAPSRLSDSFVVYCLPGETVKQ